MSRRGQTVVALLSMGAVGCSRAPKEGAAVAVGSAAAAAGGLDAALPADGGATTANAGAPAAESAPSFSAPIAATRSGRTKVVAGLVVTDGILRVVGWPETGPSWTADVLRGVAWTPDAELRLEPAGDGVALAWRGNVGGKPRHTLVVLGPAGEPRGEPVQIGASFCTTSAGLAWVDPAGTGPIRVKARRWADTAAREVATVPDDRAASLMCAHDDVFVLGDGDDDLTWTAFAPGDASPIATSAAIRDSDFGDDEEREHDAYTHGDTMGLVRVSGAGAVAIREVSRTRTLPWRRLKHRLAEDDDVVAVDGDGDVTLVVFTHEASQACDGGGAAAEGVRALRVDLKSGQDSVVDLVPPACDRARGPFWVAMTADGPAAAWVERPARTAPNAPSIDALVVDVVGAESVRLRRVEVRADAVVDGTCGEGCFAAALTRSTDADGSQPGSIALVPYP